MGNVSILSKTFIKLKSSIKNDDNHLHECIWLLHYGKLEIEYFRFLNV